MELLWRKVRGEMRPCLDFGRKGGRSRRRQFFATEDEARRALAEATKERDAFGRSWVRLQDDEKSEVGRILDEMRRAGTSLSEVWAHWKSGGPATGLPGKSLGDAVEACIQEKSSTGRRPYYVQQLAFTLRRFARGREKMMLRDVSGRMISEWVSGMKVAACTVNGMLGRLGALTDYAVRMEWIEKNPMDGIQRVRVDRKPAVIFSAQQCRELLSTAQEVRPTMLAWIALCLFCGVRPEEAERLRWEDVNEQDGVITISAAGSKVRNRRIVHMTPQAVAWVGFARKAGGELPISRCRRMSRLTVIRDKMGLRSWPHDVLRKTFASNMLTITKDAAHLALEMGTSVGIIYSNYREVVTRKDAAEWAAIMPK